MSESPIRFLLNGQPQTWKWDPVRRLLHVLRIVLGLTGSKDGCGEGECGACTVIVDGELIVSCLLAAGQVPDGAEIMTVEGLEKTEGGRLLQASYVEKGAAQCGFCIPGMIMSSYHLLSRGEPLSQPIIREAHAGNICRCTGYEKIMEAVSAAAEHWPKSEAKS